jgi:hypothetical protein
LLIGESSDEESAPGRKRRDPGNSDDLAENANSCRFGSWLQAAEKRKIVLTQRTQSPQSDSFSVILFVLLADFA